MAPAEPKSPKASENALNIESSTGILFMNAARVRAMSCEPGASFGIAFTAADRTSGESCGWAISPRRMGIHVAASTP